MFFLNSMLHHVTTCALGSFQEWSTLRGRCLFTCTLPRRLKSDLGIFSKLRKARKTMFVQPVRARLTQIRKAIYIRGAGVWGKQKENVRNTMNDMTWKAVAAEIRTRLVPSWHCQHSREKNPDSKQWLNAASVRWTQATVSHCFEAERLNKAWRQGQAFTTTVTAWRAARWVVSDGSICYSKQLNWWS